MSKVLIDADPGTDDAVALAALLAAEAVDVVGVTTVAGNSTVENTTANARSILELFGREDVPVARGCERPLVRSLSTGESIHGPGGLRGDLPAPTGTTTDAHAVEFIREQVDAHGTDLTIACMGPLTNLAVALALDPSLPDRIGRMVAMGGAFEAAGNVTPVAEYNVYVDPAAASRVVQTAAPTLVPLDVTDQARLPASMTDEFRSAGGAGSTIAEWCSYPAEVREAGGDAIHDAAVAAHLLGDVLTLDAQPVSVVDGDGPCRGATIADTRRGTDAPTTASVATEIDVNAFRRTIGDALLSLL
ncbi:Inosine-uridine nucleoside N-ribohydrolase [Natronoarchaeum philippinense]|uniref:Inosine-uridine nucleoside N-ribohydrolase n=1 Tax=Natronoarchaeum philippinense TaxID=558529 RepID=A0A285NSD2_NATPI|nr:nucleoside hydrolase [Natronoarchaeum philippinense]SNZ12420.1 Inosine-uridine nucleoside N-ribohydrolase [Natronoarchaeum philippinense]